MKITLQPTHVGTIPAGHEAYTVNCHEDDGTELVLFNAVWDGKALTAINGTRKMPADPVAAADTMELAAEALAKRFVPPPALTPDSVVDQP
ncbi:MAG: hypothetical protein KGO96_14120 [Elusimicrobia bacterium]|nr:hypothetical protein [Elusimicrobiota bacterium]